MTLYIYIIIDIKNDKNIKVNSQFFGDDEETKKMMAQFYDDDLEFSDDDEVEE